jgi:hypothetical protein
MSPSGRWALTPPFHPYRAPRPLKICLRFCLRPITEAACAGGFFSVALSVARPSPAEPPGVTRRAALRSPDFPPGTCLAARPQRSPGPLANTDYTPNAAGQSHAGIRSIGRRGAWTRAHGELEPAGGRGSLAARLSGRRSTLSWLPTEPGGGVRQEFEPSSWLSIVLPFSWDSTPVRTSSSTSVLRT